ncbi:hypothetical protein NH44784_046691 [Achromobacter xylosoxidans NH44784-1996]|nr:hypothetical protein NH44784_046691 [Achromobacter xylosoxidans NH44784-1996]
MKGSRRARRRHLRRLWIPQPPRDFPRFAGGFAGAPQFFPFPER